ncbi:putative transcription factor ARF family [Lupinus albus]|uniref:Auxin response factor n=1 Tax=Lupinus albus TaxID=3870 RepID=A0A6A4PDA2_LUPAL|nr:putative transcription factor ARF family [Lupinus albus]
MRKVKEKMDCVISEGNGASNNGGASGGSSSSNHHNQGVKNELKSELWRLCAGPSVYVPGVGEKVFYFPQGHLEQVAAFTQHQEDGHMDIPAYDLPSNILCRVMSVQLKAEANSDEVFAQITLVPELKQNGIISEDEDTYHIPERTTTFCSFIKILTASDTSPHGGFSIPKLHANECLPPLDMTLQTPTQELVAKDLHGFEWHFTHKYRGEPKRHLLTSGWSTFVNSKKLVAGDACIFLSGENGELCIGIRRAKRQHNKESASTSLISSHSMQLGILTTASHAVATGSMFTVYYHPWMNPFEFIVPVQHYMKSTVVDYSIGMRVHMQIEVEDSTRRYAGSIISIGDIDSIRWLGSTWRCLEVQWDAIQNKYMIPERVCPWWIEPLKSAMKKPIPILPLPKKARVPNLLCPGLSRFSKDDILRNPAEPASQRGGRVLQGKDYINIGSSQPAQKPPPSKDAWLGLERKFPFVMQDPPHQSRGRSVSFPHEDISTSSSNMNSIGSVSQGWPSESKEENHVSFGQPGLLKLFGVNLTDTQMELPSPQFAVFSQISSLISIPPLSQTSIYATIPATKPYDSIAVVNSEKKCKNCHSVDRRSCTKVLKQGTALGRAIDLKRFSGYDELISELDSMFDFGGSLVNGCSGWHLTSIDDDGFMTLLGDYPWQLSNKINYSIIWKQDYAGFNFGTTFYK